MKHITTVTLILASVIGTVNADLILDLRLDDASRDRSVASGTSVFVDMFLVDTDGSSAMSLNGLIGGGGRVFDAPSGTAATGFLSSAGSGFTNPPSSPTGPGIASAEVSAPFLSFVSATAPGVGVTTAAMAGAMEVFLARFQVTANGGAGDTHTLTAGPLGFPSIGNVANGFPPTPLDAFLTASGAPESVRLTVSGGAATVPEPSSFFVAGILGGIFLVSRRRRCRDAQTAK